MVCNEELDAQATEADGIVDPAKKADREKLWGEIFVKLMDDAPWAPVFNEQRFTRLGPDGTRYVSFADWLCPVHCIEPAVCPVIRGPRTWEMGEALGQLTDRLAAARPTEGPVLFECRHRVHGVGMFDRAAVLAGDAVVARAGERIRPWTSSSAPSRPATARPGCSIWAPDR